ncbi:uncharacterized protein V1516DRAFT_677792 [Lipomyces oligophaga]|uniref:uncharacterized protein n=1 Tax=Lipomyces oligophaga TaxID=45792 RepID=UPI0034CE5282
MASSLSATASKLWSSGNPDRLYQLARQIESRDAWRTHLNPYEHALFAKALAEGGHAWRNLISPAATYAAVISSASPSSLSSSSSSSISGNTTSSEQPVSSATSVEGAPSTDPDVLRDTTSATAAPWPSPRLNGIPESKRPSRSASPSLPPPALHTLNNSTTESDADTGPKVDMLDLSLKVRYMLYEKSIDYIFASPVRQLSTSFDVDFSFLDDESESDDYSSNDLLTSNDTHAPAIRKVDEGDYDDDDDDEINDNLAGSKPSELPADSLASQSSTVLQPEVISAETKSASASHSRTVTPPAKSSDDLSIKINDGIITPADTPTSDIKQLDDAIQQFDWNNTYQTLDTDSGRYTRPKPLDPGANRSLDTITKLSQVNFGAANLSLKHLLSVIDEKRQGLSISDLELRNLISDVRKNRSKWASEERVGQEELYEAAEKVVLELRAFTEHSTAFLNRVNKRDAPNYFNVIKNPMDLSTVMKKLKLFQYRSKQEFVDDLMLIWNNCFEFNTDPNHYLRKHALAMKKKTLSLMPLIPDITIRTKAEIEHEALQAEKAAAEAAAEAVAAADEREKGDEATASGSQSGDLTDHKKSIFDKGRLDDSEDVLMRDFVYDVIPNMPESLWNVDEKQKLMESELFETAVDLSSEDSPFLACKGSLTTKMNANLAEIQQIRKITSKIAVIKRMQQQAHLYTAQLRSYNPEKLIEKDMEPEGRLPGHGDIPREVAEACMRRSISKVAMHVGYEECQLLAMEGLTALAGEFMERLGRTLSLYLEANRGATRYSLEDTVMQTLYENGVYNLRDLETYVREDVDRLGVKLQDVRERMGMSLADYLRPALVGKPGGSADSAFDDGSQEFVSGGFSDEIGEDFFGFKELGLDEEFGLSSLSVPLHLLHSRLHANANVQIAPTAQNMIESAPPFEPMTRERVEKQIGLIRGFLMQRFDKFERDNVLLEDEALPPKQRNQRPRLPPTGKITVVRKRSSEHTFASAIGNIPAAKKKKIN